MLDEIVIGFDRALRTLSGHATSSRPTPGANIAEVELAPEERRHAAGLMRVNHTGEVCAQALYAAQALVARDPAIRKQFAQAAREEEEHLAWTRQRLAELSDRTSLLNPALVRRRVRDRHPRRQRRAMQVNLGFVVETERQVEEHLTTHMEQLPPREPSAESRAIVEQMRDDEVRTGRWRRQVGLPRGRS